MKSIGALALLLSMASCVFGAVTTVPEIDAGSAVTAVALLSGGLLILRGRRKK